ncbi:hypothetical protein ABZ468_25940 [Streptomyces sp. NPDC005708]|uniref:hypothetical protein n=1 Tax=Streptomyces sp. NPDC005708 TaxID=3154564 RepID=UPI0033C2863A
MSVVYMRHPELPGQEIQVGEAAVPVHAAAGWERVPDEELEQRRKQAEAELAKRLAPATEPTSDPAPEAKADEASADPEPPAARPKRRRASEGE